MDERKRRERKVAKAHGGKAQPASGSMHWFPRDVLRRGVFMMEHKSTEKNHYYFDIRDFTFLERQCQEPLAIYCIEFSGIAAPTYIVPADMLLEEFPYQESDTWRKKILPGEADYCLCFTRINKRVIVLSADKARQLIDEVASGNGR